MLPPVPAILLTVKGGPNEPDEISVVWTFVINGKPPQVGISADVKHVANKLVDLHREFYTMGKRVGHIGMTVGREAIKY